MGEKPFDGYELTKDGFHDNWNNKLSWMDNNRFLGIAVMRHLNKLLTAAEKPFDYDLTL